MTTRGDIRLDIETHESGTAAATGAMSRLNKELGSLSILRLDSAISVLQQFGQMAKWAFEQVKAGEQANNIQRVFNATVRDSAAALESARRATIGTLDDTTLQKRVTTLNRMNLSLEEQRKVLEATTKLSVTSGEAEETVFRKVIGALSGRKTALKDYGIVVQDSKNAINEMSAALDDVRLEDFQSRTAQLGVMWDNTWSTFQQTMADGVEGAEIGFKKIGGGAAAAVIDVDELTNTTAQYREALRLVDDTQAGWVERLAETHKVLQQVEQTKTIEFFNMVYGVNLKVADSTRQIADAYKNVNAAVQESISAWTALTIAQQAATQVMQANVAATTAQVLKVWGSGAGGARRGRGSGRAAAAAIDEAAELRGVESAGPAGPTAAEQAAGQQAALQRSTEMQQLQLQLQLQLTEGMGVQTTHQVDHALAIERQIVALQQRHEIERASLEHSQDLISDEQKRHRITMANKKAEGRLSQLSMRADSQKRTIQIKESQRQKQEFTQQFQYWGDVGKAIGQTAALLASNEQERAGIMAAMAVLDATMAGIRIISDMGVAGIPLAAATVALGVATAAGYAAQSGGAKPPSPGGFGAGFQATAIQDRPDSGGGNIVYNINAGLVVGGTTQEIGATLKGVVGDDGGMRAGAA